MTGFLIILLLLVAAYMFSRRRPHPPVDADLRERVEYLERRVSDLQLAVETLRRGRVETPRRAPTPPPPPRRQPAATPPLPRRAPEPAVAARIDWRERLAAADLMGAKALAIAGGVVTLLGVVFFFVLAVNRGWIGPELRVACGGLASAIVFAAGVWLQRRYETTYSALAAVGAGIAGAYATLLAAVALYDLVSKPIALVVAAAIASVGVGVSLAWSAELVAGFGLIGAMVVPATLVLQGGLQPIGTAFVAVVFAGTGVVAVRERWWTMLKAAALVSAPQALAQLADGGNLALALAFWLPYVAAGVAYQLRVGRSLAAAPASFLTGSAVFAVIAAALLYEGERQGLAVLVAAATYLALCVPLFLRARELATLTWLLGLGLAAVGLAQTISGSSLTIAWAAEAAILAWVTSRTRESRFQLAALAYLALAVVHALAVEASPDHLFQAVRNPAAGAPAVVAIALAAAVFAAVKRSWESAPSLGLLRVLDPVVHSLNANERLVSLGAYGLAGLLTAYAASLGILELFAFQWGHVVITSVWAAAGIAALVAGVRELSLVWLALVVAKVLVFDLLELGQTQYGISLLAVGAAVLTAGLVCRATLEGAGALVVSVGLVVGGAVVLMPDDGLALLSVGAVYVLLGAATFRDRDASTLLWALGLTTAGVGAPFLVTGVWLVLAYAAAAALLAYVSVAVRERRLQVASLVFLVVSGALALGVEAPPADLVLARAHPAAGVPSLLFVVAATSALAWSLAWHPRYRLYAVWVAGALSVYAASLAILDAAQRLSPEGVHTDFQRGHTAVSAFWGLLALASLYVGLRQRRALLRGGGFLLFAISLGKLFLFDLPSLSSAQRALSFLAVGAVLLLGGFFYQRLSAQYDEQAAAR